MGKRSFEAARQLAASAVPIVKTVDLDTRKTGYPVMQLAAKQTIPLKVLMTKVVAPELQIAKLIDNFCDKE